jgi:hypothetical protein
MKKFFFFAAAVVSMAACQKEAQLSSNDFTAPVEEGAAVAVEFCSNVKASVATKAQGGVDAWNAAQNLHIYGYQRVADGVDYTTAVPFINNVVATSPAEGAADNKLAVLDTDQKPFYYVGNNTYDFYGFYVDDLNVEPATTETGIYVPVVITGNSEGVKQGGKLMVSSRKLKVSAPIENLPDTLEVDITTLGLGKTIVAGDLSYEGINIVSPKATIICAVKMTRAALGAAAAAKAGKK